MKSGGFTAVVRLPMPWPPEKEGILFSNTDEQTTVLVIAKSDGSLAVLLNAEDGLLRLCEFQPLKITGSGSIILTTTWNEAAASIRINGRELLRGISSQLPHHSVETQGEVVAEPTLLFPELSRDAAHNDAEALFLGRVIDLDRTILEREWYKALNSGTSIRQLLLDGFLAHVNRPYGIKFKFLTNDVEQLAQAWSGQGIGSGWFNCDPTKVPGAKVIECDLDNFLKSKCVCYAGNYAMVKDVIKVWANSKGAVHFGPPKTGGEEIALSLDDFVKATGLPLSLDCLLSICRVTLKAVSPLVEAICK